MSGQRLTDAQIATALRAHLPERAVPGLRVRVMETVESTAQQRPIPTLFAPVFDADPLARRRSLLIAAALLLALALASAAAVGALRLIDRSPTPELSLAPPSDVPAFVGSVYDRLPDLPPVAITTLEDGAIKGRTYVDRSGAVRFERYPSTDATEPETYKIMSGSRVAELVVVGADKVWLDRPDAITEDPRVFLLADTTPNLARDPACVNESDGSPAQGWHYVGLEHVTGRPTHHVACADADLWIDVETALILRTRGPVVDDAFQIVPGKYRTIEVTELAFGDQPARLFDFTQPQGAAQMSEQEYSCSRNPGCNVSPPLLYTPPPGMTAAPPPSGAPNARSNGWIAYVMQPTISGDGPSDIYLVREGAAPKLLAGGGYKHGHNACPAFSPDGTRLAYTTAGDGPGNGSVEPAIVVIELDEAGSSVGDETRIPLSGDVPCPKWSGDGEDLVYFGDNGDLLVTHIGGDTAVIPPPSAGHHWGDFVWSPVDDLIAAIGPTGISLIPTDGGKPTLLREAADGLGYLSWSPDGTWLAVTTEIVQDGSGSPGPIRIIRVDGTEPDLEMGSTFERVSWSPAGDRIAYDDPGGGIVIVDPDGGNPSAIPTDVEDPRGRGVWKFGYALTWSPDGRRMLSVAKADWALMPQQWVVLAIDATGDPEPVLLSEETMDLYAIRPDDVSWQSVTR